MSRAQHPGILVDVERGVRMPIVAHREIRFGHAASFGWLPSRDVNTPALVCEARPGAFSLVTSPGEKREVALGSELYVESRRFRIERTDEVIIDPQRVDGVLVFNAWYSSSKQSCWRGIRLDDPERAVVDVRLTPQLVPFATPSLAGVSLQRIAEVTLAQGARMDRSIAAAMVAPLAYGGVQSGVLVDWDGGARLLPSGTSGAFDHPTTFDVLIGKSRKPKKGFVSAVERDAVSRLVRAAPAAAVAAVVRALFPGEWALEAAIREQAAILGV